MSYPRVLIIGYGSIGRRHSQVLQSLNCHIAFVRSNKGKLATSTDTFNYQTYYSLPEGIESFKPHYIVDCSPSSFHLSNFLVAHRYSIPILSEKPFLTRSIDTSDDNTIRTALNCGFKCGISFQYRFHPTINFLLDYLSVNNLNTSVKYVTVQWREYLPSWHSWEDYRHSYASSKLLGGGSFLTMCHPLDYIEYLFGPYSFLNVSSPPTTLDIEVNDSSLATLDFISGVKASIFLDFSSLINQHTLSLYLADKSIVADLNTGIICINSESGCSNIDTSYSSRDKLFSDMHIEFQSWLFHDMPFRSRLVDHLPLAFQLANNSSSL